jgi:hypothetical protein
MKQVLDFSKKNITEEKNSRDLLLILVTVYNKLS